MSENEKTIQAIRVLLEPRDEMSCEILRGIVEAIYLLVKGEQDDTSNR